MRNLSDYEIWDEHIINLWRCGLGGKPPNGKNIKTVKFRLPYDKYPDIRTWLPYSFRDTWLSDADGQLWNCFTMPYTPHTPKKFNKKRRK